jgi:glycine/D-amino acid oxidase-like deaminating enzyme
MVTERMAPLFEVPSNLVRQTAEGSMLLGYTAEDAGFDTGLQTDKLRDVAWRCRTAFPFLDRLRVTRMWAALRIMTPDGFPVYDQSTTHKGVFVAACHSGVTLAAAHALVIPHWITGQALAPELECFRTRRFDVQEAA